MNNFFSIVIPIYNGLSHSLPICLDSIWSQPLDSSLYEVICIDDCSKDNTRQWLHEQKQFHPNLRIIENKENLRQGGSRNKGIVASKGRYILFIDQDDYFCPKVLAHIYDYLKEANLEILIGDCSWIIQGQEKNDKLQHNFPHTNIMSGDEMIAKNSIPWAPWKYIICRSFIMEHHIFFEEHERIEDVDWCFKLVHAATKVQYQPILLIYYNKNTISTTMTAYKSPETIYSTLRMGNRLIDLIYNDLTLAPNEVKKRVIDTAIIFYNIALREYLTFYDSIHKKRNAIVDCLKTCGQKSSCLIRIATQYPLLFSITSNLLYPILRVGLKIFRIIKYKS